MLNSYLERIFEITRIGDATEESYYSCLVELLKSFAVSINRKKIQITTLPKKTDAGNPDFRIWDGKQNIVGYIEAKRPLEENLSRFEETDQTKRYLKTFPNLILTNLFEFRLYRNGHLIDKVQIARPFVLYKLGTVPPIEKGPEFFNLLEQFFSFVLPKTYTARTLAIELAKRTRFLKEQIIIEELKEEERKGRGFILGFYEAFQKFLIHGLSKEDFADLYSQTITYGLFAARTRAENGFNRRLAFDYIPATIGILRDIFRFISLEDLPPQMEWIVDDISEVLSVADVRQILHRFYVEGKGSDPIIHFYETFLAEYDPKEREKRGVYYTPEPVVSYIVRSLNTILKEYFGKEDGFASQSVTVLDPAAGTLTFLAEAAKIAAGELESKYGEGGKKEFIRNHILKDFYAFELMMAPYAVGHLKMAFLLEELGCRLDRDDRFKLYLTNTLEMDELEQTSLPGMVSLSEESHMAGKGKKETPILVILGNPPYSGISANMGEWITNLIEDYKYVDGEHFHERKHWLQDDYVKFIRFAQWKIENAGEGILGFITNHGYLDNPTFRGMRQSLMKSFNEIYLLDLHGNNLKKEKCPDGSKDENVFDIQQGVVIAIFVKVRNGSEKVMVYHSERWGLRDKKYKWLLNKEISTTKWKKLKPVSPYYFFIPRDEKGKEDYERYWKLTDIFPVNITGIVTSRDHFVIDFDKEALKRRIVMFRNLSLSDEHIKNMFKLKDTRGWKITNARRELANNRNWDDYFSKILYRPFDIREIYYTPIMIDWGRLDVMRHMMHENLSLCFMRQVSLDEDYTHFFVSEYIVDNRTFLSSKGIIQQAPLYLYYEKNRPKKRFSGSAMMLFEPETDYNVKKPNISASLLEKLNAEFKKIPAPEQIFYYVYAVLYSNTYRIKYTEFLKIDFPRVPFTKDYRLFIKMAEYGKDLVEIHLLKSKELNRPIARFHGEGDNRMKKQQYDPDNKRVYINSNQFFDGIENEVWEYQIGGYQVCDKWLKDRKDHKLSLDEIKLYCKIVTAIKKTVTVQREIDTLYPVIEKDL